MSHTNPETKNRGFRRRNKNRRNSTEWLTQEGKKETIARRFIKKQLINSTGAICALCGKPITNMKDCTIDHIIPVSKGGLTTIENCQLAHRKCNLIRGAQQFDQHQSE